MANDARVLIVTLCLTLVVDLPVLLSKKTLHQLACGQGSWEVGMKEGTEDKYLCGLNFGSL